MIKDERGQSMLEFALLVPLLLLLVCGIFDIGRLMYSYMQLQLDVQEAVRMGGLGKSDAEITAFARDHERLGDPNNLQVTISPTEANRRPGEYVTVTLEYPLSYITPLISQVLPAPVVTVDSTIRVE